MKEHEDGENSARILVTGFRCDKCRELIGIEETDFSIDALQSWEHLPMKTFQRNSEADLSPVHCAVWKI